MDAKGVRIISLEAREIYQHILDNGVKTGYILPPKKSPKYFYLFKNILDYSLDAIELEKTYPTACRRKNFSFADERGNEHTLAVINVKFNYVLKDESGENVLMNLKELRQYFYNNGFVLDGARYVRYKRSSGSSRQGKCLFIDERMLSHMEKWGECGLTASKDLASWEAYKSLSLSSIHGVVHIPLEGIVFIPDYTSEFDEEVISVEEKDGRLFSKKRKVTVKNDIWDGQSLLDESLFAGEFADRHMLLLRNKFFKSCAFKTKLQKWFADKNITSVETLKNRGFITFATDIRQIVMVTTPNSMKFLKFMQGKFTQENIQKWINKVDGDFGVVKYDKRTKFFGGKMVQTSYQFINTLGMDEAQAEKFLQPSHDYLATIRTDYDFMRYHFTDAYKREIDGAQDEKTDGLAERGDVFFRLMQVNYAFKDTKLYYRFRNDVVEEQKQRLKEGNILLSGTNATLFGNGPEMLLALSGEFDLANPQNSSKILGAGEIACARFLDGKKLVCARSPHITMGNLYCVTNNLQNEIWQYFDLGKNIVCVNAIGENIQQRLNGCDYDSDAMLITDDEQTVALAHAQKDRFCVPFCNIPSKVKEGQSLVELDHNTSENLIGQIVNLSQKLNSILWDKLYNGAAQEVIDGIYEDICVLAVLSGIEIDKAKRAYENTPVGGELARLSSKYGSERPQFFKTSDDADIEKIVRYTNANDIEDETERKREQKIRKKEKRKELQEKKHYTFYHTAMEYIYRLAQKIKFQKGRPQKIDYARIIDMIREPSAEKNSTTYAKRDAIIRLCEEYKKILDGLYRELHTVDDDEKETVYARIMEKKAERNEKVAGLLTSEYLLYLILKAYEKGKVEDWKLYAPILDNPLFVSMLKRSKEKLCTVMEDGDGAYTLYGRKYTKIP